MIGLYYLPVPVILHESGLSAEAVERALTALCRIRFAEYDPESEYVWVYEMAQWQVLGNREIASPRDKRVKGVRQQLQRLGRNPFTPRFHDKYAAAFRLEESCTSLAEETSGDESHQPGPIREVQSPGSERGGSPFEAPSKPLPRGFPKSNKEKEQEQRSGKEAGEGEGSGPPERDRGREMLRATPEAAPHTAQGPDPPPPPQSLVALFRELRLQIRPELGRYVGSTADDEASTRLLMTLSQLHGWVEGKALFRKVAETYVRDSKATTPTFAKLEVDFDYWRERTMIGSGVGPDTTYYGDPDDQRERNKRLLADREGGPVT